MKKTVLRKYANLIARCGVNVQPGQEVFIAAGLDQPEFVRLGIRIPQGAPEPVSKPVFCLISEKFAIFVIFLSGIKSSLLRDFCMS